MDRMKLRSELYLNPKTDQCVCLVVNNFSNKKYLAHEVQKLLLDDEKDTKDDSDDSDDSTFSCSLHVNQFRLRLMYNDTCTDKFLFDNGSTSGDEIMNQIKQVTIGFEIAGVKIVAIGMDGGGENMRRGKLLYNSGNSTSNKSWLNEEDCIFVNLEDPSRRIVQVLCSTLNRKGARN